MPHDHCRHLALVLLPPSINLSQHNTLRVARIDTTTTDWLATAVTRSTAATRSTSSPPPSLPSLPPSLPGARLCCRRVWSASCQVSAGASSNIQYP
jgi:hypothetical protein